MVARSVYARTNDTHLGAFLPHRSKLCGLPVLSQALDRGELVRSPVRSIDSMEHFSNTFVFLRTCGLLHAKLAALGPQARSLGWLLLTSTCRLEGLFRSDSCERFRGWRPGDGEEAAGSRYLFMALVGSSGSRWGHGEVEAPAAPGYPPEHCTLVPPMAFLAAVCPRRLPVVCDPRCGARTSCLSAASSFAACCLLWVSSACGSLFCLVKPSSADGNSCCIVLLASSDIVVRRCREGGAFQKIQLVQVADRVSSATMTNESLRCLTISLETPMT